MSRFWSYIASTFQEVKTKSIQEEINELRQWFEEEYYDDPSFCEKQDYKKVMNEDFFVSRFILFNDNGPVKGLDMLKNCLTWRKQIGLNKFDPLQVPKELYILSPIFIYLPDRKGRNTLYIRGQMSLKFPILQNRVKESLVYMINKIDSMEKKFGSWSFIVDATGSGFSNVEVELIQFLHDIVSNYYPLATRYTLIYGASGFLRSFSGLLKSYPSIKFVNQKQLFEYISPENVPDFMGGSCTINYRRIPKGAKTFYELGKDLNLDEKEINNFLKPYLPFMVEETECEFVDIDFFV